MARFLQKPGSAGTWDERTNALTITLGEVAEIMLDGGGPPGQERLDVSGFGASAPVWEEQKPVGNRRLIRIAPRVACQIWIVAKLPGTNIDYAAPLTLVTLPRKASSLGPEHVILFAPSPGTEEEDRIDFIRRQAVNSTPEKEVIRIGSLGEFSKFLIDFRDAGRRIASLQVFSHGDWGTVFFGHQGLNAVKVRGYAGQGFHNVFAPNARVFFSGCMVAEDAMGVNFLKEFGQVFLINGGGSVAASTSSGYGLKLNLWTGKQYHFSGETRRLYFDSVGRVVGWEGLDNFDLSSVGLHPAPALAR